jgi:hypothetical protein
MDLGFVERQGLKLFGWRLKRMDWVKRWGPFVGSVVTVVCAFLKATGYNEEADVVLRLVAFVLPIADTPEQALATTAATSAVGLTLQVRSRWKKARAAANTVSVAGR